LHREHIEAAETATHSTAGHKNHPRTTVVRLIALSAILALVGLAIQQRPSAAAPVSARPTPVSILPTVLGSGLPTHSSVSIAFLSPMDVGSVADALQIRPASNVTLTWSPDARRLLITPRDRWATDSTYLLTVPAATRLGNGSTLGAPLTYEFTTQTAPTVTEFVVDRVGSNRVAGRVPPLATLARSTASPPDDTASHVSASTSIRIGFTVPMNRADVDQAFLISPFVPGRFSWQGTELTFTPASRLAPGVRYAVSLAGAHDQDGNPLGGDLAFSFTTASAVSALKTAPADGATGVSTRSVQISFSGPVDPESVAAGFALVDTSAGSRVRGAIHWSDGGTRLTFTPSAGLPAGHHFRIKVTAPAHDMDGNAIQASASFTTRAASRPAIARIVYPSASASASAQAYALSLINAARRAYGFAPLRLDAALGAVAAAHAQDEVRYGYFSHTGRDGSTPEDRMRAAGISFTYSGENECLDYGGLTKVINWCHSVMMAEPYPGYWNHIANILNPNFKRVGIGYARASDGKVIMVWDFAG
jgi:uncharacterized protein YkwD